jgi:cytochrome P450
MHPQMIHLTLSLVGRSLFGRSMGDLELEQIASAIATIQSFIVRQIVHPYLIPWYRISGQSRKYQRIRLEANHVVLRHIQARRDEGTSDMDLLRVLLETPYPDTGSPMSEEQALIESLQLLVAGNETSSNALTWLFYLLGRHPHYIQLIRDEVSRVIGDEAIDVGKLHQLELTLQVVHEALRLYPPFWMIDRIALREDSITGIKIPAGTLVIPYIYGVHHNSALWSNPDDFDPSRFEPEQKRGRHRFSYIPFGGGPRICIGNNMAVLQILLIVISLVRRYDFTMASDEPVAISPMMLLRPVGPVTMRFEPLQGVKLAL